MFYFWQEATAALVPGFLCQSGRCRPEKVSILSSLLFNAADAFRVTWTEGVFSQISPRNAFTEIAWADAKQGLGMAMSTLASEKNRELLFIGNEFYKQWHLWVLFH